MEKKLTELEIYQLAYELACERLEDLDQLLANEDGFSEPSSADWYSKTFLDNAKNKLLSDECPNIDTLYRLMIHQAKSLDEIMETVYSPNLAKLTLVKRDGMTLIQYDEAFDKIMSCDVYGKTCMEVVDASNSVIVLHSDGYSFEDDDGETQRVFPYYEAPVIVEDDKCYICIEEMDLIKDTAHGRRNPDPYTIRGRMQKFDTIYLTDDMLPEGITDHYAVIKNIDYDIGVITLGNGNRMPINDVKHYRFAYGKRDVYKGSDSSELLKDVYVIQSINLDVDDIDEPNALYAIQYCHEDNELFLEAVAVYPCYSPSKGHFYSLLQRASFDVSACGDTGYLFKEEWFAYNPSILEDEEHKGFVEAFERLFVLHSIPAEIRSRLLVNNGEPRKTYVATLKTYDGMIETLTE